MRGPSGVRFHAHPSPHFTTDGPLANEFEDPNLQVGSRTAGVLGYWFDTPVYLAPCPWGCEDGER